MPIVSRVLDAAPISSLAEYGKQGGGAGLRVARALAPDDLIATIERSGLRGRGGAGFPTGRKWRTVVANASPVEDTSVVVNAAEGEPGSFKDREIVRRNPYRVIEGALIAAHAVGASKVIIGMKRTFTRDIARVRAAIEEIADAGWIDDIACEVVEGPPEYLLGEETALCEVIDGRAPFPRIAPPYRRGVDEIVESSADIDDHSSSAAHVELAAPNKMSIAAPTLVDNVETLANVAMILAHDVDWFRSLGTDDSPGTVVCTVSGATTRAGVGEVAMGTPLREAIMEIGGGVGDGHDIAAVLQGVSAAVISPEQLDTPLTWEAMAGIGSGLGATAFIVFDDTTDPVQIAAAASRFLAVESCGQCTPCKQDGLAISDALERMCRREAETTDLDLVRDRITTIADSARCSLATQHQTLVGSLLAAWPEAFEQRAQNARSRAAPAPVLPIHDLVDGAAALDIEQLDKQPDWSHDWPWSGQSPADALDDHRSPQRL
jgi:NADH:ubiquinone oxidoreductase subunit F (NADH-binding)